MMTKISMIAATIFLILLACNVQAAGNVKRGADLTYDCIECHGMDGKGDDFETPSITGLSESHILKKLRGFYSGKTKSMDNIMHTYTEDRTDQDLQDLAAYWATKK